MSSESRAPVSSGRHEIWTEKSRGSSSSGSSGSVGTGIQSISKGTRRAADGSSGADKINLSQHIGAPAKAQVAIGDQVTEGQRIAEPAQGLSVAIHASISGVVTHVSDKAVVIEAK